MHQSDALAFGRTDGRAPVRSWPAGLSVRQLLYDAALICFFFGISGALTPLGIPGVEKFVWLPADLAVAALLVPWRTQLMEMAKKYAIFLSWPALACISAIWSLNPAISLYHGIQLLMTILVGFMLCMYASLDRILQILFAALVATAVLSLAVNLAGAGFAYGLGGEWLGVFPHKNLLGHMMVVLIFTGMCLLLSGWRPLVSAGAIALAVFLLAMSRSGAAWVGFAVAMWPLPLAFAFRKGATWLAVAAGLGLAGAAAILLVFEISDFNPIKSGLNAMGKDETLTGRTILWDFGMEAFNSRPWLGFGFRGYWESPETTMQLLRVVIGQDLWYFHNNFIEVAVAFGFIGPIVLGAGLAWALFAALRSFARDSGYITLWPLHYLFFVLALTFAENPLVANHSIHQVLLIVAVVGQPAARQMLRR
jgi:exopolysaccharide production protein ExoQ